MTTAQLNKNALAMVQFARFCINQSVSPLDAAELGRLANQAFKAGERFANLGTDAASKAEHKAGRSFEAKAESLGFTVEWYGLWPTLLKDGSEVSIPG